MSWTRWTAVSLCAASLLSAVTLFSCTAQQPGAAPSAMTAEQKLARGEYLVAVMSCGDCHTPGSMYGAPDPNRALAGSDIGWLGPWGVVYAANLTSDPETGLGSWTEEQIVTAIRTGNRPDGRQLAPAMPWMNLSRLTDEDAAAIAAFLKTVPAVSHAEPAPVPPDHKATGALMDVPPPPAWDVQHQAPPGSGVSK